MERKIIHVDMDAFFASVEQREHPEWKGKPVIVGGSSKHRGVVSTCSYEAREYGVRSAMPIKEALKLCPTAILSPVHFDLYRSVSREIRQIFYQYTDLVEPLSIDEAYLDVTDNRYGIPSATIVARKIKREIFERTGLTCSVGVSFNKFLAKVASGYQKPAGITIVDYSNYESFLFDLPIEKFYGVGKITAQKFLQMDIKTGRDLFQLPLHELIRKFGKQGYTLYYQVRGKSNNQVMPNRKRKSIGKERTLMNDTTSEEVLMDMLRSFAHDISLELKKQQHVGKTITLKIRTDDFQTMTKSTTLVHYVEDEFIILEESIRLFEVCFEGKPVRLIGVSVGNLKHKTQVMEQLKLF